MSGITERRRHLKKEAKFFLRYNYVKQVFMTGLVVLLAFGLNAIKSNIIRIFGLEFSFFAVPLGLFFDLTAFFITLPMYVGIVYVNVKLFEGESLPVSGVFYYFTSADNLLECYKFMIALFARLAVYALPFLIVGAAFPHISLMLGHMLGDYAGAVTLDFIMLCVSVAYLAAFIICAVVFMRYFAALFIFIKNPCLSVRDIMVKSAKLMKRRKIEGLKLILSFAFWVLVSHFLAGFLYIFFTVPYMTLSYAAFMSYLLTEKGGEDFLSAAGDYIDEAAKKRGKTAETVVAPQDSGSTDTVKADPQAVRELLQEDNGGQADIDRILEEETVQIDGIVDEEYELGDCEQNRRLFRFLDRFRRVRK